MQSEFSSSRFEVCSRCSEKLSNWFSFSNGNMDLSFCCSRGWNLKEESAVLGFFFRLTKMASGNWFPCNGQILTWVKIVFLVRFRNRQLHK